MSRFNITLTFPHTHRLIKEVAYYEQETRDNEALLEQMGTNTKKTPHDVKKFKEVVEESRMMIPDSQKRLQHAVSELRSFVTTAEGSNRDNDSKNAISGDSEWYKQAVTILQEQIPQQQPIDGGGDTKYTTSTYQETNLDDLKDGEQF